MLSVRICFAPIDIDIMEHRSRVISTATYEVLEVVVQFVVLELQYKCISVRLALLACRHTITERHGCDVNFIMHINKTRAMLW